MDADSCLFDQVQPVPDEKPDTLRDAIRAVVSDPASRDDFPEGLGAVEVLTGIRERWPDAWPLISWLDVHDEMTTIYGPPTKRRD